LKNNLPQQTENTSSLKARLASLFYIAVLGLTVYVLLVMRGASFLANISNLQNQHIYVAVSSWDIPAFIGLPCFVVLIAVLILRMKNGVSEVLIQKLLKVAIAFALIAIVVRVLTGFSIPNYLESKGYTYCPYYGSPALMSANIWVRSPEYCVENSGSVRKQLLNWFDSLPEFGRNISQADVRQKVGQLLAEYDQREQDRY
jgi:hypothetical protein